MGKYPKESEITGISPGEVEGIMEQKKETPRGWERREIEGKLEVGLRDHIGGNRTTGKEVRPEVNPKPN